MPDNAHAIGGVTCHGKRYIYNGYWTDWNKRANVEACPLMHLNWRKEAEFCLGPRCTLPKINTTNRHYYNNYNKNSNNENYDWNRWRKRHTMCFNTMKNSSAIYVLV